MNRAVIGSLVAAILLLGCGGSSDKAAQGHGEVTGIVFDQNGNPVRDARVWYDGSGGNTPRETSSNSTGTYTLTQMPAETDGYDSIVEAQATIDGVVCSGQNVVRIFDGERSKSMNIALVPQNQLASIHGSVSDSEGYLIQGARVFVRPHDTTIPTSSYGITDDQGDYQVDGLQAGVTYDIQVNAYGYSTDSSSGVVLSARQNRQMNFNMGSPSDPNLPAPKNLIATAWTSPNEATRDQQQAQAIEGIKNLIKPKRATAKKTRDAANGYPIEVDLEWDQVQSDSLLGYGIYRGSTASNVSAVEFVRDPLAVYFADSDQQLVEGRQYVYAVSALNTTYEDSNHGESALSSTYSVTTLGALTLGSASGSPTTFQWSAAYGAAEYTVYVFDDYPTASPTVRFQSPWSSQTSYTYGGPSLVSGRTYYYLVVGRVNNGDSLTVSRVGSFQP